jgi:hypothetical protein
MTKATESAQIPTLAPLNMPIEEAMRTQRVLRRLRPDPVDDALVLRLLEGVIPLVEYQRRRQACEQKQQGLATREKQLEIQVDRQGALTEIVQSIAAFCQRVQAGLANATFAQKRR